MSLKGTAVLFGVLVALCLGYWLMLELEDVGEQRAAEAKRLFTFGPEELVTVEVARLGEEPVVGKRTGGGAWSITAPHDTIEANQIVWQRLVKALAGLSAERTLPGTDRDLAAYGLDEPAVTVSGATADGTRVRVALGLVDPTQLYRYACLPEGGDARVFLVNNDAFHELDRPLIDLRNRYLVTVGDKGITRLEFALFWRGDEEYQAEAKGLEVGDESVAVVAERDQDGSWRMVEPVQGPADREWLDDLVKEVQFAVGRDYMDAPESLADYGLDPPVARITVVSGDGPRQTILFGGLDERGEKTGLFAKRASRPSVFVMGSHVVSLFPRSVDSFRERRLLTRRASDIERIHYQTAETDVVLENDPEQGWSMIEPAFDDVDQVAASRFIATIKSLTGVDFPEEPAAGRAAFGLDQPAIAITLTFPDGGEPAEILVGALTPDKTSYYATQDTGVVLTLPESMVETALWTVFDFRTRQLMRFPADTAVRVALRFEGADYWLEKVHGKWLVRQPADYVIESPSDMDALLAAVNPARAVAVEADKKPKDPASYGLDAPLCVIAVTVLAGDAVSQQVGEVTHGPLAVGKISEDDSRQRFATMLGHPEVFRVQQDIVDDLRAALRGIHGK